MVVTIITGIDANLLRVDPVVVHDDGLAMTSEKVNRIAAALLAASRELKIPVEWLVSFARIESNFNPLATNGSSRGLFQIQKPAWMDARVFVNLPDYEDNWQDPYWNALAACAYIRQNLIWLSKKGHDATANPRWIYLAHQQGAGGLSELINLNSGLAFEDLEYVTAEKMLRNPAPGFGITTDRIKFYNNWMKHLEKYFPD